MKFMFAAAAAALALSAATSASATLHTYTTQLDWSNFNGSGATQAATSWGQVTITEVDANNVTILIDLYGGLSFVNTGNTSNHLPFTFNLSDDGASVLSVVLPDPNVDYNVGPPKNPKVDKKWSYLGNGSYDQTSDFKTFTNAWTCCGQGGGVFRPSPFEFNIYNPNGISFLGAGNDFVSNAGGWWFSADVVNGAGKTFLIGGRDAVCEAGCNVTTGVPEPGTWALMIVGFMGAGAMLRRRRVLTA
jgi:hypothetical protein